MRPTLRSAAAIALTVLSLGLGAAPAMAGRDGVDDPTSCTPYWSPTCQKFVEACLEKDGVAEYNWGSGEVRCLADCNGDREPDSHIDPYEGCPFAD